MQRLGTLYRGRAGMWTWVLHRISGVAILFYRSRTSPTLPW
jgi:succinate dehydrogenase/fumarate reductase cytochrome b subunit